MRSFLLLAFFSLIFMVGEAQQTPTADAILKEAFAKASKENKKVLVIFHASWCGWCHKMDASLNDPSVKNYFDKNYVIEHLTIQESPDKKALENPGADELNAKWGGAEQGLPFGWCWIRMEMF